MKPTIVVDNFFNDPDSVVQYANSVDFYPANQNQNWPGLRSKSLHEINYDLFLYVITEILSNYYTRENIKFTDSYAHFHKIEKGDVARIHNHCDDDFEIAAVIYLSEGDINEGTTLYNDRKKHIVVSNEYNSMVSYDANKVHGPSCVDYEKDRLTIVAFIRNIELDNETI